MEKVRTVKNVAIVDDEAEILSLYVEQFADEFNGYAMTYPYHSARRLLESKRKYDLIISDWCMPGSNGDSLIYHKPDSKFIIVTGWPETAEQYARHHNIPVLGKPMNFKVLFGLVESILWPEEVPDGRHNKELQQE